MGYRLVLRYAMLKYRGNTHLTSQDPFIVKGQYATAGYIEFLKRPIPDTNSPLVDLLLDAGSVLYCKTNLPQSQMVSLMA